MPDDFEHRVAELRSNNRKHGPSYIPDTVGYATRKARMDAARALGGSLVWREEFDLPDPPPAPPSPPQPQPGPGQVLPDPETPTRPPVAPVAEYGDGSRWDDLDPETPISENAETSIPLNEPINADPSTGLRGRMIAATEHAPEDPEIRAPKAIKRVE